MSELYEKSLQKLELDQVLELLAQCAGSSEGKAVEMQSPRLSVAVARSAALSIFFPTFWL